MAASVAHLETRQLERAFDELCRRGWTIGSATATASWRDGIRARARRAGIRVRTGTVTDGRPWAAIPDQLDDIGRRFGLSERYAIPYFMELAANDPNRQP